MLVGLIIRFKMVLYGFERYFIVVLITMGIILLYRCLFRLVCMECFFFGFYFKIEGVKNCYKCICICKSYNILFYKDVILVLVGFVCGLFILVKLEIGVMMMIMIVYIYSYY